MGKALDLVKKIRVVEFDWKNSNKHDIGLIAEEIAEIIPEAVWYKNGKIEGLKPLTLIAILVEAVKELGDKHVK